MFFVFFCLLIAWWLITRMVLILPEYSQRPYRYGMTLLCVGAMFNWLGLAENNAEPVRYIGVTLIAAGAMLICLAMCFWMKASHDPQGESNLGEDSMHHIVTIHQGDLPLEKPPDYDSVTGCSPPCYEDAIRLNPSLLLPNISSAQDVTDSTKQQADISNGPELSTITSADMHCGQSCPPSITNPLAVIKTENDRKASDAATTATVAASPSDASAPEESSQSSDNFGSRMLRLSKRLLRVKRGSVNPQEGESSSSVNVESAVNVTVNDSVQHTHNNSREDTNSAASTSTLPVR